MQKKEFIPLEENLVRLYSCGPTVYDAAHLGHAATYIAFDYKRRIMDDYFGYDVRFATNITDFDSNECNENLLGSWSTLDVPTVRLIILFYLVRTILISF